MIATSSESGIATAELLFSGKEMTYYVALFQQRNFWRVIKTPDDTRAELIYKDFVRQTVQLSDVEIRRTRLEAQKGFTERMIALSQDRANRLQADPRRAVRASPPGLAGSAFRDAD
jgi:hypothetical protein